MKKLFQAADVEKCLTLFKKGMASLIIFSMLMVDVAKAMEEEYESLTIQRTPSPRTIDSKSSSGLDKTGSPIEGISASAKKATPEREKNLTHISAADLSLSFSQSSSHLISQPLDVTQGQPSPLPPHSDLVSEIYGDFKPAAVGPFKLRRLNSIAHEASLIDEKGYPQLSGNWREDGTLIRAGSLQDRSAPFTPRSKSVAESSHNNGKPTASVPDFILSPVNSHPLEGSDPEIDSAEETAPFLGNQENISRSFSIQSTDGKRRLSSSPAVVSSSSVRRLLTEASKLLENSAPKYSSIQDEDGREAPPPSVESLEDPENQGLPAIEEDSKCCSCFSNHSLWPQPTEYVLLDASDKIQKRSALLTALTSSHHNVTANGSDDSFNLSPLHGSLLKDVRESGVSLPLDEDSDDPELAFENSRTSASIGYQRLVDLPSPANNVPVPSSLLVNQDIEEGDGLPEPSSFVGSLSPQERLKYFLNDLKKLPAKAKTQLVNFTHQILHGKSTWPQRLGKWIIGPTIAAGFSFAMAPVYDGGIHYLAKLYNGKFLDDLLYGSLGFAFAWYITFSALPDAIARNAHLWKKGIAYLAQEGKEIGRMWVAGGISFLTAFIPPTYLITYEVGGMKELGVHGLDNQFAIIMLTCCPALFADAIASDFNTAWSAWPQIKEWLGNKLCLKSLHASQLSSEESQRKKFDKCLNKLAHFLYQAPEAVIDEIYDTVKEVKEGAQAPYGENNDEALATQQAFSVLSYLLSLGDEIVQGASKPKSMYDLAADVFKYACLLLGTPARALALQFIGATVFGLFCPEPLNQILGGIYGIFALLPQTYLEDQGMDNFFKRFIFEEDPHGHGAHPVYRGLTKLYCILQGLIYTFPLAVLTLQAFQQWFGNGWWPLIPGIPFFIPEFAAQIYSFNGTFNHQVATSITNVHNTKIRKRLGKDPTSDWKRDWLIRFVQESNAELNHWHPDLINKLTESINIFQKSEIEEIL